MNILKTVVVVFILSTFSYAQVENLSNDKSFMLGAYYYAWYGAPKNEDDIGWMK